MTTVRDDARGRPDTERRDGILDYRVHTFLAVYRQRSYTRAADALHITQQSLSAAGAALELCARGVGACFCPENLARLLLAAQPHGRLEMLRMPDTMAYPISFGYTKHAYPWSVLADFIRIARAQYPQPA